MRSRVFSVLFMVAVCVASGFGSGFGQKGGREYERVSMMELLVNPIAFSEKKVEVQGYLGCGRGDCKVFFSREAIEYLDFGNAITVAGEKILMDIGEEYVEESGNLRVVVQGVFTRRQDSKGDPVEDVIELDYVFVYVE